MFSVTRSRRALAISATTLMLTVGGLGEAIAVTLKGAGASFPKPLYTRYFAEFKKDSGITVTYDAVGSGQGIESFIADSVDFAGTDAPPTQSQVDEMPKGMVPVTTAGGAVAVTYNIPGVSELKLSREVLAKIFQGQIETWNDSKIAKDNPGVTLPDLAIQPVVREDGSGTTYIFTRYLSAISPQFKKSVSVSPQPNWPGEPLKGPQNEGVAKQVQQTEGAIGYVQDTYARGNKLAVAQLENITGDFVAPTLEDTYTALNSVRFYQDLRAANLNNPDTGYPIVGVTWILVKQEYETAEKADSVKQMINWILTEGQGFNEGLEYTKIPEPMTKSVMDAVQTKVAAQ
ncbi:MAG: phosphate ABC transporter substrate-binding protein PstS [Microcoleaceae cyanobacterium]